MRIVCIADSPFLHTGFGNVANQIYRGFVEEGHEVCVFGMLDWEDRIGHSYYHYKPVSTSAYAKLNDQMGLSEAINYIGQMEPDIVWVMLDPGNITMITTGNAPNILAYRENYEKVLKKSFKIVAYVPVEGLPLLPKLYTGIKLLNEAGDKVITWTKCAQKEISKHFDCPYIYFGLDHAPFEKYSEELRKKLRQKVGFDDYFIVGSVGVNKRTKGFIDILYAAKWIKGLCNSYPNKDKIKFYLHTNPDNPTMQGYYLREIADELGVSDMILWKPDIIESQFTGTDRVTNVKDHLDKFVTDTPEKRKELFANYSFIDRLNCLDMYLDTSQVEGWGLPQMEAMACGVPVAYVGDDWVRDELLYNNAYRINPAPFDYWDTWHSGQRLVKSNPGMIAASVLEMLNDIGYNFSQKGLDHTKQFKWDNTRKKMNKEIL